jgi:hypothetical protein
MDISINEQELILLQDEFVLFVMVWDTNEEYDFMR